MNYRKNKIIEKKGERREQQDDSKNGFKNPEKRYTGRLHGRQFIMLGEISETHDGRKKHRKRYALGHDSDPCIYEQLNQIPGSQSFSDHVVEIGDHYLNQEKKKDTNEQADKKRRKKR